MPPTDAHRDAKVVPLRPPPTSRSADLNLRILWSLARWVEDHEGEARLAALAASAGLDPGDFDGRTRWVSLEQVERFLEGARALVPDDETFMQACAYRLKESYGPFRYLLWAVTPAQVYAKSVAAMGLVSRISDYEMVQHSETGVVLRYHSKRPESRLMCLSRMAQGRSLPTVWGLPAARVEEGACVARGDPVCEYRVRTFAGNRWMPMLVGAAAGLVLAAGLGLLGAGMLPTWLALPALGAALAYAHELKRVNRLNLQVGGEVQAALREMAEDDSAARREMIAMQERQRSWSRVLEEQVNERTEALEHVVAKVQEMREARESALRGFSHDLRNPLAVLVAGMDALSELEFSPAEDGAELLADLHGATRDMQRMLTELMEVAVAERPFVRLVPERLAVGDLPERLGRRLAALVHGRDIKTTVFATREAPGEIETDLLIFDRIVDNLLTNAAKYTERGSIVVEVAGRPGFLTLKVSDTGRGISEDAMRQIFQPGGSKTRAANSYGIGLSVVVQLLSDIGGRLEVMSRPEVGTTFWAHFPTEISRREPGDRAHGRDQLLERVVTIRKAEAL